MNLYPLDSSVFSLKNNPAQFLNGLTSNTSDRPQNAFLNIHGRIVAVFYQIYINSNECWIVVPRSNEESLLAHIDKYLRLSGIACQKLRHHVYFDMDGPEGGSVDHAVLIPLTAGRIILSENEQDAQATQEQFTLYRLKHGIPLQGVDFTDEFVLNVASDGIVSFTKGCFLGQEPVSKVHNRSRPTWQLVVEYEDKCDADMKAKMTSMTLDPATNRMLGFVFKHNTQDKPGEDL